MIRKLFNVVADSTHVLYPQTAIPASPFTKKETQHLGWLVEHAPCFPISPTSVTILTEPQQFYNNLLNYSKTATERITLASLYLGNGELEKNLVNSILTNPSFTQLRINILLDYSRGSRFANNSRKMLMPLLKQGGTNCNISLYHTPVLRGLYKKLMPNRWNELFGVQHMKLYIFDDTLIISGANLSNDYFTNRQDRYFIINDKNLCDFYCGLVQKVQGFSINIDKNDREYLSSGWDILPYKGSKYDFIENANASINEYIYKYPISQISSAHDTWVFPLVQMGQFDIYQDVKVTETLIAKAPSGTKLNIATAYFNLTKGFINSLIFKSNASCNLLMAHPKANGFLGAKGMAGGIPDGYTLFARRFKNKIEIVREESRFNLQEYLREDWTYHAKGLWYYSPECKLPCLTLIGSPNFGNRSVLKDLESQIAIVTENKHLKLQLHAECERLYKFGLPADFNRDIPAWVHAMVFLFRDFF